MPRRHRSSLGLPALVLSLVCGGCGRGAGATPPRAAARPGSAPVALAKVEPGRWYPSGRAGESRVAEEDPDGSVRVIERGLRLVEYDDGRILRARELLPDAGAVFVLRVPPRLGGGFVFRAAGPDGTTALYRARQWTDELTPLVRLPFEVADLVSGFDRLYALSARTRAAVGIDPRTGSVLSGGGLPASAAYGGAAFRDGWLGAVDTDIRGVLVTFDAGATFHPLRVPTAVPGVMEQNGSIVISTPRGAYELLPSGDLRQVEGPASESLFGELTAALGGAPSEELSALPEDESPHLRIETLGGNPLELSALRGIPDSKNTAVVVARGRLVRVSLDDGRVLETIEHAAAEGAECQGVPLGSGEGFVCGEDRGPTVVYALRAPLHLEAVLEFPDPRRVMSNGRGALAIHGPCSGASQGSAVGYCVAPSSGEPWPVDVQGDTGVERLVALASGDAAVLVPPRLGAPGTLRVIPRHGAHAAVPLVLHAMSGEARELAERGLWLDGMTEVEDGALAGWVFGSSTFMGVRVKRDGKVVTGPVQRGPERALVSGRFALLHGDAESRESTDGGMTWADVPVPPSASLDGEGERGCSPVGCGAGSFFRIGWGGRQDLVLAKDPPKAKVEAAPFVTWAFDCAPTGESETSQAAGRASPLGPRAPRRPRVAGAPRGGVAELESSSFRPFLGVPAPERLEGELGFDFGTEDQAVQVRGYAWGDPSADWSRAGSWLVRAVDRFAVRRAIWSTAVSRPPWGDAAGAAEAFGSEPSHRVVNEWMAFFDPDDDGGVLRMRTGTRTDLAVLERDRAIVFVRNADDFVLDHLTDAVKVAGGWYLGAIPGPRAFQVLRIEGGTLSIVASYPRQVDDAPARLVRSTRNDALGIWVRQRGRFGTAGGGDSWLVYPVDPKSGEALPPLVLPPQGLARAPAPCGPESEGWVLPYEPNPSLTNVEISNVGEAPAIQHLEARLVASSDGLCLDALAAQVDGDPPKNLSPKSGQLRTRPGVVLALTDRATDRRWGFRCAP